MGTASIMRDSTTGTAEAVVIDGEGPTSQSRNRNLISVADTYAAATNKMTWNEADNIRQLEILITAAGAGTDDSFAAVAINAPSDAVAAVWLDLTQESADEDVQFYKIPINKRVTLRFDSPITRADWAVQPGGYTSGSADIWAGAN